MLTLGIVESTLNDQGLSFKTESNLYHVLNLVDKKELTLVNGVVITIEDSTQILHALEWIIACQEYPKAFIWIFSKIPLNEEKKIMMDIGATYVMTAPEDTTNLFTSIKNVFARLSANETKITPFSQSKLLGDILDIENRSIHIEGKEIFLTRKQFELFRLLLENKGSTVSYEALASELWSASGYNRRVQLANMIYRLRQQICFGHSLELRTIRSKGYMLQLNATTRD